MTAAITPPPLHPRVAAPSPEKTLRRLFLTLFLRGRGHLASLSRHVGGSVLGLLGQRRRGVLDLLDGRAGLMRPLRRHAGNLVLSAILDGTVHVGHDVVLSNVKIRNSVC